MAKLRVAYGSSKALRSSVSKGKVPLGTLLLTRDTSEILFYDHEGNIKKYKEKYKFLNREEANAWLISHNCRGQVVSIREGDTTNVYVVDQDNKLKELTSGGGSGDVVQADYLVDDPEDPAFIKNKPTSFSMEMIEGLLEALNNKAEVVSDITPGALMLAAEDTGKLQCSGITLNKLVSTLDRKAEVEDNIKPGYLTTVDEQGILHSTNVLPTDIVKSCDIVAGSITYSKRIDVNGEYVISIPEEVKGYSSLSVYHNGLLLAEGFQYMVSGPNIILRSYTTYEGDIFSFVGHGATTNVPGSDSHHTHANGDLLNSITQDRVNLWDNTVTIFKINGVQIPVENGTISFFIPTKSEDIGAAPLAHTHDDYVSKKSLFDEDGFILPSILPEVVSKNSIEVIMLGDSALPVIDRTVVIPVATKESLGVVRSSEGLNRVSIDVDGTMSVKQIDFSTIEQPVGHEIILSGGDSKPLNII